MATSGMGFQFNLGTLFTQYKKKNRWLLKIPDVSAEGLGCLPPAKMGSRSLSFNEIKVEHMNESIKFPGKPDWKSISLTLYDLGCMDNPVLDWINLLYDAEEGDYGFLISGDSPSQNFKSDALLELYSPCGDVLESFVFENAYPSEISMDEMDMSSSDILYINLTLNYDRMYRLSV